MLTLEQIRQLTGQPTNDAVRVALRRGKAKTGAIMGTGAWPPKKAWTPEDVWRIFGARILERAATDPDTRALAWKLLSREIRRDAIQNRAAEVYPEALNTEER